MRKRILGSLTLTFSIGFLFLIASLLVKYSDSHSIIDQGGLTLFFLLIGILFIVYGLWTIGLFKKFSTEEKQLKENYDKITNLQSTLDQSKSLFYSQIEMLKTLVDQKSKYDTWQLYHSPIGVLVFYPNGTIDSSYSYICNQFFGEGFTSRSIQEILYTRLASQNYFKQWLEILPINPMPFHDLTGLLETENRIPLGTSSSGKAKFLDLQYKFCPVGSAENAMKPDKVVVFILDITNEKKITAELEKKESKLEFILNILRDKNRYMEYLDVCLKCIEEIEKIANNLLEGNVGENIAAAFRLTHTIKGNSAAFGVQALKEISDSIENLLIKGRDGEATVDLSFRDKLLGYIPDLQRCLDTHIQETEKLFHEEFDPKKVWDKKFSISEKYLQEITEITNQVPEESLKIKLLRKLHEVHLVPIKRHLLSYAETIQHLGLRQGKKIAPLVISGGEVLINDKGLESFFASFIHLILNCVDHGVETPAERLDKGKAEEALIRIRVQTTTGGIYLSIEDDGRGIDLNELRDKAIQKHLTTELQWKAMTIESQYNIIFKEGFSTSRRITSTSGRGVGMSAIKHEIEKLNGHIKISSKTGKGTMFTIFLPIEAF